MDKAYRIKIVKDTVMEVELQGNYTPEEIEEVKNEYPRYKVTHLEKPTIIITC